MSARPRDDIIGQKFGRLLVLRRGEDSVDKKSGKHKAMYWCQCDCGSPEKLIRGASIVGGSVQSCGCLHSEVSSKTMNDYRAIIMNVNDYYYEDNNTYMITSNTNRKVLVDAEDVERLKKVYWYEQIDRRYCSGQYNGKAIKLHEYIMNPFPGFVIDHKNGNPYDNRKSNLRPTLQALNARNKLRGETISGIKLCDDNYEVTINCDRSKIFIGSYKTYEEAILYRFMAEIELYGEYSTRDNCGYDELKTEALKHFKPICKSYILDKKDFINWGNNKCYFDDYTGKFTNNNEHLTMAQYYLKNSRMEVFYKYFDNVVCFGYVGLELADKNETCLKRIFTGNMLL